jgi:Uma2 family endonuclease
VSDEDEVQPDLFLRVASQFGGQSDETEDDSVDGAPELAVEIAHSSRAIDLHLKKERYAQNGVLEYLVLCLRPQQLYWFDFKTGDALTADSEGIVRSRVYPGLWLDAAALFKLDYQRCMDVLNRGLAAQEHARFAAGLDEAFRQSRF